jgi:nucleotide-binding universal stress UspA family protein
MTKVLVATDGSELSVRAAHRAFELLGTADDVVVLAVLTEMPGSDAGGFEGPTETPAEEAQDWKTEVAEAQQALAATLTEVHGAKVEQRVEAGDAGPMIVWVAEQIGADLVVVGSHGRGVLKRMVVGSVSEHVVHHASCPVLVVPRGRDAPG